MMHKEKNPRFFCSLAMITFLCVLTSGCTSPSSSIPAISTITTGILDWENATITLPIDFYGMNLQEQQIVEAAKSATFDNCVAGDDKLSEKILAMVKSVVTSRPYYAVQWLYGAWDASYIAENGMDPSGNEPPVTGYIDADPETANRCMSSSGMTDLEPIFANYLSMDTSVQKLSDWYGASITSTSADKRYMDLLVQLGDCLSQKGYSQDNSLDGGGFVFMPSTWSREQVMKANLAEAQCEDSINMTQQAANISAEYQMQYIKDNQAELLEIKRISNERVEKAKEVLRNYGILP